MTSGPGETLRRAIPKASVFVAGVLLVPALSTTFQQADVQILGLSASHAFSQQTVADSLKIPCPLLGDFPDPP